MSNIFRLGFYESSKGKEENTRLMKDSRADFIIIDPDSNKKSVEEFTREAKQIANEYHRAGTSYLWRCESTNWREFGIGPDGHDWYNCGKDAHRMNYPPETVRAITSVPECLGIMHDEMEHAFINRNVSITLSSKKLSKRPLFFPLCETKDVVQAEKYYEEQFKAYADSFLANGSPRFMGEHVFPVLYHLFARVGITPCYKQQKESYSNIQAIIAGGASLQYDTELWTCIDMWYRLTYPGHSPNELKNNLLFSYLIGCDYSLVEGSNVFYDKDKDTTEVNEYGRVFTDFSKEYAGRDRGYSIRDYRPRIGIIRLDDSYWGQGDPVAWLPVLYGNPNLKVDKRAKEWLKAMNLITFGESSKRTLTWSRIDVWSLRKHRSFCSMNSPVVFDDKVGKEKLESLELCFLCGYHISDKTLNAVSELVREKGLIAVTPKRLAPDNIKAKAKGRQAEIPDGKGRWLVTNNPCSRFVKSRVSHLLGKKGEMAFRFKDRELTMRISPDGEAFDNVTVKMINEPQAAAR